MPRLTKRTVEAARPNPDRDVFVWDSDLPGFGLRVSRGGTKAFVIQYRPAGGRQARRLTLAKVGTLTTEDARKEAQKKLADVVRGGDPAAEKRAGREEPTVRELTERFEREHIAIHLKPKTARPYRRIIADRIVKSFGTRKLSGVSRADVAAWHHRMRDTPVEANRALLLLHKLYKMAEVWGWHEGPNPAYGVQKYKETARKRYLTGVELYRIGKAITDLEQAEKHPLSPYLGLGFRLLLLTGMRRDEVLTLRWDYVDEAAGVIRLPDSKTGAKTVVLSAPAVDLLKRAPREKGSPWVVTGARRNAAGEWPHVANPTKGWERVRDKASKHEDQQPDVDVRDVTLHDCRHAFASVGVSMGLSLPAIGALLGHADQASTARYSHLQTDPLKVAADLVGKEIAAAMNGVPLADVVGLNEQRDRR